MSNNYTRHVTITKTEKHIDIIKPAAKKRFFGRRKTFIDPFNKSMRYSNFETYEENKLDYYATLQLVYSGKCKDIYEAYSLNH